MDIFRKNKNKIMGRDDPNSASNYIKTIFETKMTEASGNPALQVKYRKLFDVLRRARGRALIDKHNEEAKNNGSKKETAGLPIVETLAGQVNDVCSSLDGKSGKFFAVDNKVPNENSDSDLDSETKHLLASDSAIAVIDDRRRAKKAGM